MFTSVGSLHIDRRREVNHKLDYRQTSYISRTKYQNFNISRLALQSSLFAKSIEAKC